MFQIKSKLSEGRTLMGTFVCDVANPNICHIFALAGFDFIILDNEHGSYNPETVSAMAAAARGAGIGLVVRIPEIRRETVMKPLDAGADGILAPMVDTAEQARALVKMAKFPPRGIRGCHPVRPGSGFGALGMADYLEQSNRGVFIAVQAETEEAVKNAGEIAALEGVDSIFIGPLDLSIGLGAPGQVDSPAQREAMQKVVDACLQNQKVPALFCPTPEYGVSWAKKGARFLAYKCDTMFLLDEPKAALAAMRKALEK